jgi:catalase
MVSLKLQIRYLNLLKAGFFARSRIKTPFCKISTVAGSRGSTDLARDARGFAVKFYTQEGIYILWQIIFQYFFIQDSKFPDLVHAVKPEPHNEMLKRALLMIPLGFYLSCLNPCT